MTPDDNRKLKASLARLASPHDGEVIAAARAVERLLAKHELGFADLTVEPARPMPSRFSPGCSTPWQPVQPKPAELLRSHQREAFVLLVSGFAWDEWKRSFLTDIRHRKRELTSAQADKLRECRRMANEWRSRREAA